VAPYFFLQVLCKFDFHLFRGWVHVCQNHGLNLNPGMFEAQVREFAKTELMKHSNPEFEKLLNYSVEGVDKKLLLGEGEK